MDLENFENPQIEQFGREISEIPKDLDGIIEIPKEELSELRSIAEGAEPIDNSKSLSFGSNSCSGCSGNCWNTCSGSCSGDCGGTCWATCSGTSK